MNIEQANGLALPEILRKLGYLPVQQKNDELLYFSPFRDEKTASFKVNTAKNVYYDFGADSGGGDVVKFASTYLKATGEDYTVVDALRWVTNMSGVFSENTLKLIENRAQPTSTLTLLNVGPLQHKGLINYLESRGISLAIAKKYLKEALVHNSNTDKKFHTLCFANEDKGYELRNEVFKGCITAKSISFIRGEKQTKEVHLFEGFMDFLSALEQKGKSLKGDKIVLNSVTCLSQAFGYIKNYPYEVLSAWFDNDKAGELAAQTLKDFAEKENSLRLQFMSKTYAPYKDVNEWHVEKLKQVIKPVKSKVRGVKADAKS